MLSDGLASEDVQETLRGCAICPLRDEMFSKVSGSINRAKRRPSDDVAARRFCRLTNVRNRQRHPAEACCPRRAVAKRSASRPPPRDVEKMVVVEVLLFRLSPERVEPVMHPVGQGDRHRAPAKNLMDVAELVEALDAAKTAERKEKLCKQLQLTCCRIVRATGQLH